MENARVQKCLCFLHVLVIACLFSSAVGIPSTVTVQFGKDNRLEFTNNKTGSVAWGVFENEVNTTGWSYLEVYTDGSFMDLTQAYAAGLVEGYLTKDIVHLNILNTQEDLCPPPMSDFCKRLKNYLTVNLQWMYSQIDTAAGRDPYWHQVSLMLAQVNGLRDGYNGKPARPSHILQDPMDTFLQLQISGDVEDLSSALGGAGARPRLLGTGSCSALIKVLEGNTDLYVAHDTWSSFQGMLRTLKKYSLQFHVDNSSQAALIPGHEMTFPSNPGVLTSGDDFYTINTGLVTLETTIGNSNADLWQYVTPTESVLEGFRSMVANRLSTSGKQWAELFSRFNSGTYNNEWMVVDYKLFQPGANLKSDVLWVIEQIPKYVESADLSWILADQGYFPSYNSPYFETIFKENGQADSEKKYGDWFSYNMTARAQIFRRDQGKVKDITSMIKLMRYNDFKHDPLAKCKGCNPPYSGENGISARSDLNPANMTVPFSAMGPRLHGGIDMKMTSYKMQQQLEFISQIGPTYDNLPAFQWSTSPYRQVSHLGMSDLAKFTPIQHTWGSRQP